MNGTIDLSLDLVTIDCDKRSPQHVKDDLREVVRIASRHLHERRVHSWTGKRTQMIRLDNIDQSAKKGIIGYLSDLEQLHGVRLEEEKPAPRGGVILLLFK